MSRFKIIVLGCFTVISAGALAAFVAKSGLAEAPFLPDVKIIQAAYDSEEASGNTNHDKNLKIVEAQCNEPHPGDYSCFVSFTNRLDAEERLYYDVAEVKKSGDIWILKSGICKH